MTDTQRDLYAAVIAAPGDDTVRLIFADALDDTGESADARRAAFIRAQIDLAAVGPAHVVVEGDVQSAGRNRYLIEADSDLSGIAVGCRVNMRQNAQNRRRGLTDRGDWKGLLVEKHLSPDALAGTVVLQLHRDEHAGPYPKDRVRALNTIVATNSKDWPSWVRFPAGCGMHAVNPAARGLLPGALSWTGVLDRGPGHLIWHISLTRGFPDTVRCSYDVWADLGDAIAALNPIAEVALTTEVRTEVSRLGPFRLSRFFLIGADDVMFDEHFDMTDAAYNRMGEDVAEERIARELLARRWPKVVKWELSEVRDIADPRPYENL